MKLVIGGLMIISGMAVYAFSGEGDSKYQRIEELEQRVTKLEQTVQQLQSRFKSKGE